MKKTILTLSCGALITLLMFCLSFFAIGCDVPVGYVDLNECTAGDSIPVYPSCEFTYELSESDYVIIDEFTATLSQKDVLTPKSTIDSTYYPYTINISAHGIASAGLIGETISFYCKRSPEENSQAYILTSTVTETREIVWNDSFNTYENYVFGIYFQRLR